jgi:MIP family channel proteins
MLSRLRLITRTPHWRRVGASAVALGAAAGVVNSGLAFPPALCEASHEQGSTPKAATSQPSLMAKCVAEAVGTGLIIQGGCGVVCAAKYAGSGVGTFGLAAVWGVSVMLAVYATAPISGAHLNPAVTCALVACDKAPAEEAPFYIGAQLAGATVAAAVNYLIFSAGIKALEAAQQVKRGSAASTAIFHGAFGMVPTAALVSPVGALVAEAWMTAVLVFCIFAFTDPEGAVPDGAGPATIGATVATLVAVFGPVTGCGMNPARDLGPRLVTLCTGWGGAALSSCWIYTLGPLAGAVLGGKAYLYLASTRSSAASAPASPRPE